MSLRVRLVLVVAAAVAAAVVLASVLIFFLIRNDLYGQVDNSLRSQASQIPDAPGIGLTTQIPGAPRQYVIHYRRLPFTNPFQIVDSTGATYRPDQGFGNLWPLLPGVSQAKLVAAGKRDEFYFDSH